MKILATVTPLSFLLAGCAVHRYEVAHIDPVASDSNVVWGTFSVSGDVEQLRSQVWELRQHLSAAGATEVEQPPACTFGSRHISITAVNLRVEDIRRYLAEYTILLFPTWYFDQPMAHFTFEEFIGCSRLRSGRYVEHFKSLDWLPVVPVALAVRRYRVSECLVAEGMALSFLGTASTGYAC